MTNPIWKNKNFSEKTDPGDSRSLSLKRVISRATFCFILLLLATVLMWTRHYSGKGDLTITIIALAAGFASTYISFHMPQISSITVPVHAVIEGLAVGGISAFIEVLYPGLALNAVFLTFAVATVVLSAYRFGVLVRSKRFIKTALATLLAIGIYYILNFVLRIFSIEVFGFISPLGMGICFLLTAVASYNLVGDLEFIEEAQRSGTRSRMEWTAVLGLLLTMGWIYLEFFSLINLVKRSVGDNVKRQKDKISTSRKNRNQ